MGTLRRTGEVVIGMLADARWAPIEPPVRGPIAIENMVHTDGYAIDNGPSGWDYNHRGSTMGGEYARGDDGDGSSEVHVETMGGFRPALRNCPRRRRGILREELPA